MKTRVVCLAAGEGKRMLSAKQKMLHEVCGKSLVCWAIDAAKSVDARPVVVVGQSREQLFEALKDAGVDFAVQAEQKGTGHAVMVAREFLTEEYSHVVVMAGDMPLIGAEDIHALCQAAQSYDAAVATAKVDDPTNYGRIVRDDDGHVQSIVEHRDADETQLAINEINLALYVYRRESLLEALDKLTADNNQGEYYLTDTLSHIIAAGGKVTACVMDAEKGMGVNNRVQLAQAAAQCRRRINAAFMLAGVTLIDPENTYIDADVSIGRDTIIHPGCTIGRYSSIGEGCTLLPGCVVEGAAVSPGETLGPFTHIKGHG